MRVPVGDPAPIGPWPTQGMEVHMPAENDSTEEEPRAVEDSVDTSITLSADVRLGREVRKAVEESETEFGLGVRVRKLAEEEGRCTTTEDRIRGAAAAGGKTESTWAEIDPDGYREHWEKSTPGLEDHEMPLTNKISIALDNQLGAHCPADLPKILHALVEDSAFDQHQRIEELKAQRSDLMAEVRGLHTFLQDVTRAAEEFPDNPTTPNDFRLAKRVRELVEASKKVTR